MFVYGFQNFSLMMLIFNEIFTLITVNYNKKSFQFNFP